MRAKHKRTLVLALAGVALLALSGGNGAQLKLAMEDRADPNPHQVALGVELAGLCLGIAISWSDRLHHAVD